MSQSPWPMPHLFEELQQLPELLLASQAQLWLLQDLDFTLEPEQVPPFFCCTVLYLVDCRVPPPQLLEHDPYEDQFDHLQFTKNVEYFRH